VQFLRVVTSRSEEDRSIEVGLGWVVSVILLSILIRFFMLLLFLRTDFVATEGDEVTRWMISGGWASDPFLFTSWDGVWLIGNFAYYGTLMRCFDDPLIALQIGNCLAQGVSIIGIAYTGYVVTGKRIAAMISALFAAVGYPFIWLGTGAMSEVLTSAVAPFAMAFVIQFLGCAPEESRRKLVWACLAALALFSAASQHFISWIAILTGIPLVGLALVVNWRNQGVAGWVGAGVIFFGMGLFPILWMIGSWHYLGSPLAFYENTKRMNMRDMGLESDVASSAFWAYPNLLWNQAGPLVILAVAAMMTRISSALSYRRYALGLYIFLLLLVFSVRAELSGFYLVRHRYVMLPYVLMIPLAGAAISDLWSRVGGSERSRLFKSVGIAALMCVLVIGWIGFNFSMSFRFAEFSGSTYWHNDGLAIGYWLKRELKFPQVLTPEEAGGLIGVHERDIGGASWNLMAYNAGENERIRAIPQDQWNDAISTDFRILISNDEVIPMGFVQITSFGQWRVLRRS